MMMLPLPPFILDLLFTFNIALAMMILLAAMFVAQARWNWRPFRPCCCSPRCCACR